VAVDTVSYAMMLAIHNSGGLLTSLKRVHLKQIIPMSFSEF